MRQFDYSITPDSLRQDSVTSLLLEARECKGRQIVLENVKPDILESLVEQAKFASTEASNRIEGIVTTQARLKGLMQESTTPKNRSEAEIAGYRDMLGLIHEQHDYIDVKPSVILQLHRDLFAHTSLSFVGSWKTADNQIVSRAADGTTHVRFQPTSAFETPAAIERLCDTYRNTIAQGVVDPLLASVRFIFDFVSIHPFNDGNGRMSRLLTVLLLERCGYLVPQYISIEKLIEGNKELYYEALGSSSAGWQNGTNDEAPFVRYMLGTIISAYRELFDRVEQTGSGSKADRIDALFARSIGKVTKADIREACPDISVSTIERELKRLLDAGAVCKVGAGRSTGYVAKGMQVRDNTRNGSMAYSTEKL